MASSLGDKTETAQVVMTQGNAAQVIHPGTTGEMVA